jgi:hypothetical protein
MLSTMASRCVLVGLLVVVAFSSVAGAQTRGLPDCADFPAADVILLNGNPFDAYRAVALFSLPSTAGGPAVHLSVSDTELQSNARAGPIRVR